MRVNKLRAVIYQLMFAGCVSAISTSAFAVSQFGWKYDYSAFQKQYPQYRFRPVPMPEPMPEPMKVQPRQVHYPLNHYAVGYSYPLQRKPVMPQVVNRVQYPPQLQRFSAQHLPYWQATPAFRNRWMKNNRVPAFVRQYAWEAAQPRGFRKGGAYNHYANQSHDAVEQASTPVYRTAPVSSQGFRYRNPARNANYVSFTDRINMGKPFSYANPVQPAKPATVNQVSISTAVEVKPVMNRHVAGQQLVDRGNYRFRPDERFSQPLPTETRTPVVTQNQPVTSLGAFKLANAELPQASHNRWNQWSFRPADSTF